MTQPLSITAAYSFVALDGAQLQSLREELLTFGSARNMRGLVLLATEGINSTVSGSVEAIAEWKNFLTQKFGSMTFKDSKAEGEVFKRWSVKIKDEIVTIKNPAIKPQGKNNHLTPAEWNEKLKNEDVILIDARNSYEYKIGKFKNAIDCGTRTFHEFPAFVEQSGIPKDKTVMMYCTGGIRCDKALLAMKTQGYADVYQLEGGILAYLEQFPNDAFEGECFVFDHRVAVDQHLQPSQTYDLCPHCGDPGDQPITCHCGAEQRVCKNCITSDARRTCSKRCANEFSRSQSRQSAVLQR